MLVDFSWKKRPMEFAGRGLVHEREALEVRVSADAKLPLVIVARIAFAPPPPWLLILPTSLFLHFLRHVASGLRKMTIAIIRSDFRSSSVTWLFQG